MKLLRRVALVWVYLSATAIAQDVSLEQIMADPDWIGNQPERVFWADDGAALYFEQKREGERDTQLFRIAVDGAAPSRVDEAEHNTDSNAAAIYNADRTAVAWTSHRGLYVKLLPSGPVKRLAPARAGISRPQFLLDGRLSFFENGQAHAIDIASGERTQLSHVLFADDPEKRTFDTLRAQQERTYETLVEDERRDRDARQRQADFETLHGATKRLYLGKDKRSAGQWLAPSGQHMIIATRAANAKGGKTDQMPNYVTLSGYHETTELRTRVGRNPPAPTTIWLANLESGEIAELSLDELNGIDSDPLAALRKSALTWHVANGADQQAVEQALEAPERRAIMLQSVRFSPDGNQAALRIHAVDNKDRWIASLSLTDPAALIQQHRLSDSAWINYHHNDFGWLPNSQGIWFLSEESGYAHLYEKSIESRRAISITEGRFVVSDPVLNPSGSAYFFRANPEHPGTHDVFRLDRESGERSNLSNMRGVSHFVLGPDGESVAILHSKFDRHPELYVRGPNDPAARQLTDTASEAYKAIEWVIPEIIEVPSSHVDEPIYTKLYLPKDFDPNQQYPAVMFVHGAGYTQNAHAGWPYYFREFMFHTFLTQRGYVVIDMDYRASKGYGRDWRTAIYQQMGHPELEDFLDGIDFLVDNYSVDRDRIGIYGGSYGGFMTFMALFRAPDAFQAGAALRPVADWMHYNHGYTSNILNTPLLDPEAYERSSPINFAAGLTKPLLIAAGMQDDNVFFQDSVLVVQRLMELQKEDFEIAIYPLDPHGFVHASAWLDEYRRIFKLMERYVK